MPSYLTQYFRTPERFNRFALKGPLSASKGYFQFGEDVICYGGYFGREPSAHPTKHLLNASSDIETRNGTSFLPFDPSQVIENLHCERYISEWRGVKPMSALARVYYFLRPA